MTTPNKTAPSVWSPICGAPPAQPCENGLTGQKMQVPHIYRVQVAVEEDAR